MEMAAKLLWEYVKCHEDCDAMELISGEMVKNIGVELSRLADVHLVGVRDDDAQVQLAWQTWVAYWCSLWYCRQIRSAASHPIKETESLGLAIENMLRTELE